MFFEEQFLTGEGRGTGRKDRHSSYPLGGPCSMTVSEMCRNKLHTVGIVWFLKVKGGRIQDNGRWYRKGRAGPRTSPPYDSVES